ncbi:hypothetical protein B0T25DRAFT_541147 [Lasiosphaeria hispida]|uniref:Uncharacterized protein n=1 Tax=Lasiosphaeria hispida TaxID=260671 RepID=A0AAJ0HP62_9PEZI|nr:hypothetical protein B0T25DRAFT_541147 [Lasiosphaeria hispida]
MPVSDFKNYWADVRFRYYAPSDGLTPNSSQAEQTPEPPVVSGYFWWYLVTSVGLTVLTISLWSWYTQVLDPANNINDRVVVDKKGGSKLLGRNGHRMLS